MRSFISVSILVLLSALGFAQSSPSFPPLEQWKSAILKGDAAALQSLYSTSPPAQISTVSSKFDASSDVAFWIGLKARSINMLVVEAGSPQAGVQSFTIQIKVGQTTGRTRSFVEAQTWLDEAGLWRLVRAKRDEAKLEQPATVSDQIYPSGDARGEINTALATAAKAHKNVLLVFGADWCYDCHVLDKAFHRRDIAAVLNPNYEVVHVDIGEENKNLDLAAQYEVPLDRGVPAIAVLDSSGKLLYSQKNGEWERARALGPEDLLEFLNRWKPQAR